MFGTLKKYDAMSVEKPMCDTENPGRYCEQSGRYLAAQIPRTIRLCHGRLGEGCTLQIVSPIRRITSSALLSSYMTSAPSLYDTPRTTYFDIQQDPHIFQSRLCKILEQIRKPRHWLVWLFQRSQLTQKLIVTVDDFLVSAKTSLQIFILFDIRSAFWDTVFEKLTCDRTTTPSLDR